jgi:hypothetical protein
MAETITIMKRISTETDGDARLRVWVSETTDIIPGEIFVYQKYPRVPQSSQLADIFVHIASYSDIVQFPIDTPSATTPYFRKYYLDLAFPSLAMVDEKWTLISRMIKHTVEDFVRLNKLEPVEIEVINL